MDKYTKPLQQGYKYITGMKLIVMIFTVLIYFIWKILSGKIQFFKVHEISKDYRFSLLELIERLDNIKHYILFLFVMCILVYYLANSNYKWEVEYMKKLQEKQDAEDEEDEDDDEDDKILGSNKTYPKVISPGKKGKKFLDIVGEEKEGDDESMIGLQDSN